MIEYYNKKAPKYEIEKVSRNKYLNWIYSLPVGMSLLEIIIKKKLFSKVYGYLWDTKISRKN